MKTGLMMLFAVVISIMVVLPATAADWDKKSVGKVGKLLNEGKGFNEFGQYSNSKRQVLTFMVTGLGRYYIDFNSRLCFLNIGSGGGSIGVACQSIKEGYPLFASLITWKKDGQAQ